MHKKKIIYLCNTLYQLIMAVYLRYMYEECEAHLILTDHSIASKNIYNHLIEKMVVFDKVYYVESKHLYDTDKLISRENKRKMYRNKNSIKELIDIDNRYDIMFIANSEPFSLRLVNHIKNNNKFAKVYWFEDGMSAYKYDKLFFKKSFKHRLKLMLLRFTGFYDVTNEVSKYYVLKPECMEWKPNAKIERIRIIDDKKRQLLNEVFNYSRCPDKYDEKYIFFEDGFNFSTGNDDLKIVKEIVEIVGKENFIVKVHPRNTINKYEDLGIKTNKDSSIPWEVLAMNLDLRDKILFTKYSQSVVMPEILSGVKVKAFILAKLDSNFENISHDIYDFVKKYYYDCSDNYVEIENNDDLKEKLVLNKE